MKPLALPHPSLPPHLQPPVSRGDPSFEFRDRLSELYALAQRSSQVFGSPIGPFHFRGEVFHLPRFVFFGPHTHDESLRLALLSGYDHQDLRGSLALIRLVEHLILTPELGQGLNLSIFPLVDVVGLRHNITGRNLPSAAWAHSKEPEIALLGKEARTRGYHGFVAIETGNGMDEITVELRGADNAVGVELVSSQDFEPLPVRWEATRNSGSSRAGALTLADDFPVSPFELVLRIPSAWPSELFQIAVSSALKRFILRYRGLQAYGQGI